MNESICCVCLQNHSTLQKIFDPQEKEKPLNLLLTCVPQIDWKEYYFICSPCKTDLHLVYEFRKRCLNSENVRQTIKIKETFVKEFKKFKTEVLLKQNSPKKLKQKCPKLIVSCYPCEICKKVCATAQNLKQHLLYHKGSRSFICSFCGKGYVTVTDLKNHERTHVNKREYKCDLCAKCFNTHKDIRIHRLAVHTDPSLWPYQCEVCGKRMLMKSAHAAHMRKHNNDRPFECKLCGKKFIQKCTLQKHFNTHTEEKLFKCEVCASEYKYRQTLEAHRKKVHISCEKVKRHLCHLCTKSYFAKNKLVKHLLSHTGEKPYSCEVCNKSFADRSYVKSHKKKFHGSEVRIG